MASAIYNAWCTLWWSTLGVICLGQLAPSQHSWLPSPAHCFQHQVTVRSICPTWLHANPQYDPHLCHMISNVTMSICQLLANHLQTHLCLHIPSYIQIRPFLLGAHYHKFQSALKQVLTSKRNKHDGTRLCMRICRFGTQRHAMQRKGFTSTILFYDVLVNVLCLWWILY